MPKLPLPIRALTAVSLSGGLCIAAQADTLVDIYELALENEGLGTRPDSISQKHCGVVHGCALGCATGGRSDQRYRNC